MIMAVCSQPTLYWRLQCPKLCPSGFANRIMPKSWESTDLFFWYICPFMTMEKQIFGLKCTTSDPKGTKYGVMALKMRSRKQCTPIFQYINHDLSRQSVSFQRESAVELRTGSLELLLIVSWFNLAPFLPIRSVKNRRTSTQGLQISQNNSCLEYKST